MATPYIEPVVGTEINPTTITETKNVSFFEIRVVNLELFKSVSVIATLKDASGAAVGVRSFTIEGDEYTNWYNDDVYLVNLVATKLGFTIKA